MGFRENLKNELKYRGMLVKELADLSGVPKGTIDHYLAEKCTAPIAENAVKIARSLGTTVEYLVTGSSGSQRKSEAQIDELLYKKYYTVLRKLDSLPESVQKPICKMIEDIELGS